jgi:hypothetical protein
MTGNTADKKTLRGFLKKIEAIHGWSERVWVMDQPIRLIPLSAQRRLTNMPLPSYPTNTLVQKGKAEYPP